MGLVFMAVAIVLCFIAFGYAFLIVKGDVLKEEPAKGIRYAVFAFLHLPLAMVFSRMGSKLLKEFRELKERIG